MRLRKNDQKRCELENFKRERDGYSTHEVDDFLQRMKREYNEKIRRQNEKMFQMNQEMNDLRYSLEVYKEKEKNISKALVKAVQKADEITTSARNVYDLEIKRVQLLYKKWENVLSELRSKFAGLLPGDEIDNLVGDFQYALTVTLNSQLNEKGERVYSKSVLERMQHRTPSITQDGKFDPSVTLKENEIKVYYDSEGKRIQSITRQKSNDEEVTLAEKYLNGEDVEMPKSYGEIGPNMLNIPPVEFAQALEDSRNGFSLNEALHPQESLKEILRAFDLEMGDDTTNEHKKTQF